MVKQTPQPPAFVITASLAGHLYRMTCTAKLMLLSASNAKGVAARAGDKALGFRPITNFIAEMANSTITYSSRINHLSLEASRASIASMRAADGERRFRAAQNQLSSVQQRDSITPMVEQSRVTQEEMAAKTEEIIDVLNMQLDEICRGVRGSTMVVSNSRTEATRAGEFQPYLDSIADNMEHAADELKNEIAACRELIAQLGAMIRAGKHERTVNLDASTL